MRLEIKFCDEKGVSISLELKDGPKNEIIETGLTMSDVAKRWVSLVEELTKVDVKSLQMIKVKLYDDLPEAELLESVTFVKDDQIGMFHKPSDTFVGLMGEIYNRPKLELLSGGMGQAINAMNLKNHGQTDSGIIL